MKKDELFYLGIGVVAVGLAIGSAVLAEEGDGAKFQEHKSEAIANIDARIASLNEAKACMQAASSRDGMKACHDKLKAAHEAMKDQKIDRQIERLQQRKSRK